MYHSLTKLDSSFTYFTTITTVDNVSPTSALIFAGCISTYPKSSGATTVPARVNDSDLSPSTTVSGPLTMWGQPIEVAFRQQDLSLYTTSTTAPASSANAQPSSNPITQAAATSTPIPPLTSPTSAPSNNNSLSTGAKAGIGLGVAAIGMFLLLLALFLLWRRRRRARSEEQHLMGTFSEPKEKEIPGREEAEERPQLAELETLPPELDSSARVERPNDHNAPVAQMELREHLPPRSPAK